MSAAKGPVLILGLPEEEHASHIYRAITQRGHKAVILNTALIPQQVQLSFSLKTGQTQASDRFLEWTNNAYAEPGFERLDLSTVPSVYWRNHQGTHINRQLITDPYIQSIAQREVDSALDSLFRLLLDCLWLNSIEAVEGHRNKNHQLHLLAQAGLRIPKTLVTNNPNQVRPFYEHCNGQVIVKPVRGGAHTTSVKDADLTPERLASLIHSPVTFQEKIEGVDIRVYWIGGVCFAAEIRANSLDFREDPQAAIVPITLPPQVEADCTTLARVLGYHYSGIDIRRTPEGEYVFIEGNPAAMFTHFERQSGYPITKHLVDLMLSGKSGLMETIAPPPVTQVSQKANPASKRRSLKGAEAFQTALPPSALAIERSAFLGRLQQAWALAQRHQQPLALAVLALQGYRFYVDTYGYEATGKLLTHVGTVLGSQLRTEDTWSQLEDDKLALLLPQTSAHGLNTLLERLEAALKEQLYEGLEGNSEPELLRLTAGTVTVPLEDWQTAPKTAEDLLRFAQHALHEAKTASQNKEPAVLVSSHFNQLTPYF